MLAKVRPITFWPYGSRAGQVMDHSSPGPMDFFIYGRNCWHNFRSDLPTWGLSLNQFGSKLRPHVGRSTVPSIYKEVHAWFCFQLCFILDTVYDDFDINSPQIFWNLTITQNFDPNITSNIILDSWIVCQLEIGSFNQSYISQVQVPSTKLAIFDTF